MPSRFSSVLSVVITLVALAASSSAAMSVVRTTPDSYIPCRDRNPEALPPPHLKKDYYSQLLAIANRFETTARGRQIADNVRASNMTCATCESIVDVFVEIAKTNTSRDAVIELGTVYCDATYVSDPKKKEECQLVITVVVELLPVFEWFAEWLLWDLPKTPCAIFNVCQYDCCLTQTIPEQMHINYAEPEDLSVMAFNWATLALLPTSHVRVTSVDGSEVFLANATVRQSPTGGWVGQLYTAVVRGLTPGTEYAYTVGSSSGYSSPITFRTLPSNIGTPARPLRILNIADMGWSNQSDQTVQRMQDRVLAGDIDLILHVGDVGYFDGNTHHWDVYLRKVMQLCAHVPYMTSPGNHEALFNFAGYNQRYGHAMPKPGRGVPPSTPDKPILYYALTVGPMKVLMLNSETVINTPLIDDQQMAWMIAEFSATNRTTQPFLFVFLHRPLYCDDFSDFYNCGIFAEYLRGVAEQTFNDHKVDFVMSGHMHTYLRAYPTYKSQPTQRNYTNAHAPMYLVNGAPGNSEGNDPPPTSPPSMYAMGSGAVGYGIMTIVGAGNATTATVDYEFRRSSDDSIIDQFTMTKSLS